MPKCSVERDLLERCRDIIAVYRDSLLESNAICRSDGTHDPEELDDETRADYEEHCSVLEGIAEVLSK